MIPIPELKDLSTFTTERLEDEQKEAIFSIADLKRKLYDLPKATQKADDQRMLEGKAPFSLIRRNMVASKRSCGLTHQFVNLELASRRRKKNEERAAIVEKCFVDLAKERFPVDVFQDLLDEAVDKTRG